jgi:hypothetical protein
MAHWLPPKPAKSAPFSTGDDILNHHLSCFDDGRYGVPFLELQFLGASPRDRTLDRQVEIASL